MLEKLSQDEIQFMEFFHDTASLIENLIPENIDAPASWNEDCKCVTIRPYQFAMISYEYMYADDDDLSDKQNFQNKIGAGKIINIAARNLGKTYLGMDIDASLALVHYSAIESCISSFDDKHLSPRIDKIGNMATHHKFFEMYQQKGQKKTVNRKTGIQLKNGHIMRRANERIEGNKIGQDYHGMHYKKFYYDEFSYTTNIGAEKRVDSKHSHGVIERLFGIPDLRIGSPLGKILKDEENKPWICRLPQYVRKDWDEQSQKEAIDKYGGSNSPSYKLNVEAEMIEGAFSKFNIQKIRKHCLNKDNYIKYFEIGEENFERFKDLLIIDRIPCEKVYICSDIGTTGSPSEIIIIFDKGDIGKKRFKYTYQISLFKLTQKEQAFVFKWIYDKLSCGFISLDCTNADGRGIRQYLLDMGVPQEHLSDFRMNQKIDIGFQTDSTGKVLTDEKGKPILKEEYTKEFSVQLLEKLLYEGQIEIPIDQKFFNQFSNFFEKQSGNRKSYGTSTEDHLLDSFLFFALCQWENERSQQVQNRPDRCLGIIGE